MNARSNRPDPAAQIGGLIFALLLVDPSGHIVEVNQAAENLLGRSAKRLLGQNVGEALDLVDDRVVSRLGDLDAAIIARDVSLMVHGVEQRVNLTLSPLTAHPGWRVLTMSDAGRNDAGREDDRDTTIGAPAILAHEIKNPLSAIRGAGQLVERKLPPGDKGLARMITGEVDRIARLIDRMQQLGSTTSDPTSPMNPHEAIRNAIATVRAAGGADRGDRIPDRFVRVHRGGRIAGRAAQLLHSVDQPRNPVHFSGDHSSEALVAGGQLAFDELAGTANGRKRVLDFVRENGGRADGGIAIILAPGIVPPCIGHRQHPPAWMRGKRGEGEIDPLLHPVNHQADIARNDRGIKIAEARDDTVVDQIERFADILAQEPLGTPAEQVFGSLVDFDDVTRRIDQQQGKD